MHPFVVGELAAGFLANRAATIADLQIIPRILPADDGEVLSLIEAHALMGRGLGYVDLHLLAAAKLSVVPIWTRDVRMHKAATELNILHTPLQGSGLPS